MFNLGEYRRKVAPTYNNADFFSPANEEGNKLREKVCKEALKDVIRWLEEEDGEVANCIRISWGNVKRTS